MWLRASFSEPYSKLVSTVGAIRVPCVCRFFPLLLIPFHPHFIACRCAPTMSLVILWQVGLELSAALGSFSYPLCLEESEQAGPGAPGGTVLSQLLFWGFRPPSWKEENSLGNSSSSGKLRTRNDRQRQARTINARQAKVSSILLGFCS